MFVTQLKDAQSDTLFVFFYCFECFPWGMSDEEAGQWCVRRYIDASKKKMVELPLPEDQTHVLEACAVSESKVRVLPDWEGLSSYSPEAAELCRSLNDDDPWDDFDAALKRLDCLNDYATLLGGYPRWVQSEAVPVCKQCKSAMRFLGQIDSEEEANLMWGDVGLVYLFQCPTHMNDFHLELQCH